MNTRLTSALLLPLSFGHFHASASEPKSDEFFEPMSLSTRDFVHAARSWHYERAFGDLEEDSIYQKRNDESIEIYRFALFRSFHSPFCVRLQKSDTNSDTFSLFVKEVHYSENDKNDLMVAEILLSRKLLADLIDQIESLDYTELPPTRGAEGNDGARWILEVLKEKEYHIVDRWSPQNGMIREIGMKFFKIAKQTPDPLY